MDGTSTYPQELSLLLSFFFLSIKPNTPPRDVTQQKLKTPIIVLFYDNEESIESHM